MGKIIRRWIALLLVLAVALLAFSELWLVPLVESIGTYRSQLLYDGTVSGFIAEIMQEHALTEEDLLTMKTNAAGEVTAIYPDTVWLNRLQAELNERLMEQLRTVEGISYSVPWGSVFGGVWLTELGPKLTFRLTAGSLVTTGLEDEITSVGINQTCYTLFVTVDQDVLLVYAGRHKTLTMNTKVMVVQTVLVGETPQTYVDRWET